VGSIEIDGQPRSRISTITLHDARLRTDVEHVAVDERSIPIEIEVTALPLEPQPGQYADG
jgi:hypothetical protein